MQPVPSTFDATSYFANFLGDTTPQRRDELNENLRKYSIRFVLDEASPGIEFWSEPRTGKVNVPRRCLYRMKANAFSYYSAVDGAQSKINGTSDADSDGRLSNSSKLLTWAVRTDVATSLDDGSTFSLGEIPPGLADLYDGCVKPSQLAVADEVFKMAVAWVLHHEIAHVRLQHLAPPGPDSIREEYEADQSAIDWLLKVDGLALADRIARYFGIATGLGWLSALNVYIGPGSGKTHPPAGRRFVSGIEYMTRGLGEEAELPWAVCQMILLLHAQNAGFPVEPKHMAGSFKEIAANLLQVIEKAKP